MRERAARAGARGPGGGRRGNNRASPAVNTTRSTVDYYIRQKINPSETVWDRLARNNFVHVQFWDSQTKHHRIRSHVQGGGARFLL